MKTYEKIMNSDIEYPRHLTGDAKSLMKRLLHPEPNRRLGAGRSGSEGVRNHPFFNNFPWKQFKKLDPSLSPYKPKISGPGDLCNFEEYSDEGEVPMYVDDGSGWDEHF